MIFSSNTIILYFFPVISQGKEGRGVKDICVHLEKDKNPDLFNILMA